MTEDEKTYEALCPEEAMAVLSAAVDKAMDDPKCSGVEIRLYGIELYEGIRLMKKPEACGIVEIVGKRAEITEVPDDG